MTARCLAWLACVLLAPAALARPGEPPAADAGAPLLGVWRGYAVEGAGESPDRGPVHLELTITPTKIRVVALTGEQVG